MVEAAKLIHTYVNTSVQPRKDKSGNFKWNSLPSDSEGVTCMVWGSCAVQQSLRATKSALFSIFACHNLQSYLIPTASSHSCIFSPPLHPKLLMGHQFFVLTGPTSSGAGSKFGSGLWWFPAPYSMATCHLFWMELFHCPLLCLDQEKVLCVPQ